jgi:hypothetical protein
MTSWRARWVGPLGLVVAACVVHGPQWLGGRPYHRDVQRLFVPVKHLVAESLRAGALPQWWPHDGGGVPLLAQSLFGVFHPTTLLFALAPFWTAWTLQDLAGTLLGLAGSYALVRALGGSRLAGCVAGAAFAGNGWFTSMLEFPFTRLSLGTAPWYAWALLAASRRGGAWRLLPGLVMASMLLASDPQVAMLAALAGGALLVAGRGAVGESFSSAIFSPLFGAGLAAVQLVPSMMAAGETWRSLMLEGDLWPLDGAALAGVLVPMRAATNVYAESTWIGPAVVALAAAAAAGKDRRARTLAGLVLVGVWLGLGDGFGLNALARAVVPLWSQFRYPVKAFSLVAMALPWLAGLGFDAVRSSAPNRSRALATGLGTALVLSAGAWLARGPGTVSALEVALATVATAVLAARVPDRVAAAVVVAGLLWHGASTQRTTEASFYDAPPMAAVLRGAGVGLDGASFVRIDEALASDEEFAATVGGVGGGLGTLFGLPSFHFYTPGTPLRTYGLLGIPARDVPSRARVLGALGVGVLVARPESNRAGWPVVGREQAFGFVALANPGALPRAYGVHRAVAVADVGEAIRALGSEAFVPGEELLVEEPARPEWGARPRTAPVPLAVSRPSNERVVIEGELPWPGFVVLNEAAIGGWSVTVDGEPMGWRAANAAVRAVEVPAGRHRVEWTYETPGLRTGAAVSLSVLVLAALGAWLAARRRGESSVA